MNVGAKSSPKRLLLLGRHGQLGWELHSSLAELGEVIAPERQDTALCGDLSDLDGLARTVHALRPDVVVNAAAYTAVDRAQTEPDLARRVNALAPGVLAQACADTGAWLLHYSTDYVFDGSGSKPWRETDPTAAVNLYGQTKLEGEQLVQAHCPRHLLLRTSWVYGQHGHNFARTMLRLAQERDQLKVVADQIGAPTSARWLAHLSVHILRRVLAPATTSDAADSGTALAGVYHACPRGETSWHGYARWLIEEARAMGFALKLDATAVLPIASDDYPTPAPRPHNCRLDCSKLEQTFAVLRPHWQEGLTEWLQQAWAATQPKNA